MDYRERMGGLVSVYELQAVPSLGLDVIRRMLPYVRVGGGTLDDAKTPLARMLREGDRELYVRWQRRLERARGYDLGPDDGQNFYLGSPDRFYTRFRQRYGNQLSIGLTAEKDPGEAFFRANNRKRGFDFYSAHFFLRGVSRRVKAVAIGDYNISFGQGLILFNGFGFGKSAQATNIARGGPTLRPYTSVSEFNFFRGAATTLAFGDRTELTVFASRRGRNANLVSPTDTIPKDEARLGVTSLNTTGLNRTPGEVGGSKLRHATQLRGEPPLPTIAPTHARCQHVERKPVPPPWNCGSDSTIASTSEAPACGTRASTTGTARVTSPSLVKQRRPTTAREPRCMASWSG